MLRSVTSHCTLRQRMQKFLALVAALLSTSAGAQALANLAPPQHRIVYRVTAAGRINPLGLSAEGRLMYRFRLYESESTALRDNYVGAGALLALSPALMNIGPYVEFQPLSVLGFWAAYAFSQYFGTSGLFQSYQSANADYSDVELFRRRELPRGDPLSNYGTNGSTLTIGADFQVKVWQLALRSRTRLVRSDYAMRAGDSVFYDQSYDILAPNHGWFLTDDVDLLWMRSDSKLFIGARYTATTAFYDGRQYLAGEEQKNLNALHRVGPFAGYIFKTQDGAMFNNPSVFVLFQWYLVHRFRAGTVTSQALPLMALGIQFTGDLLSFDKK